MTLRLFRLGSVLIRLMSSKPSIPGILVSMRARPTGLPRRFCRRRVATAAAPSETTRGRIRQLVSISLRIFRLVALSSTTRTGSPLSSAGRAGAGDLAAVLWMASRAVK